MNFEEIMARINLFLFLLKVDGFKAHILIENEDEIAFSDSGMDPKSVLLHLKKYSKSLGIDVDFKFDDEPGSPNMPETYH